jgi:hypothetical protein
MFISEHIITLTLGFSNDHTLRLVALCMHGAAACFQHRLRLRCSSNCAFCISVKWCESALTNYFRLALSFLPFSIYSGFT